MIIKRETDYAIRCVLYLAELADKVVMIDEIADAKEIPRHFLAKILQKLARVNIVQSYRGVKGGFRLSRRPKDISLLDVVEAIEPLAVNRCVVNPSRCSASKACSGHPVWIEVRNDLTKKLRQCNFASLTAQHMHK